MNKIVNWGHWMAGAAFAALGVIYFFQGAMSIPVLLRIARGEQFSFYLRAGVILWIPFVLTAWGIFRWHRWGYFLAITLSGLIVISAVRWMTLANIQNYIWKSVAVLLFFGSMIAWLLLPSVRRSYW